MPPKKQQPLPPQQGGKNTPMARKPMLSTRRLPSRRGLVGRASERPSPWNQGSDHPEIPPGTLDASALLSSVLEGVTPAIGTALEEVLDALGQAVEDAVNAQVQKLLVEAREQAVAQAMPMITEAVRGAVIEGMRTRRLHLAQLAVIDRAAWRADSLHVLQTRIDEEIDKAGLERVVDTSDLSLFNLEDGFEEHDSNDPVSYELLAPAYRDKESGQLVERGWVRRARSPRPYRRSYSGNRPKGKQ